MRKGFYSVEAPKCVPLRTARTYYEGAEAALNDRGAAIIKIMEVLKNEY